MNLVVYYIKSDICQLFLIWRYATIFLYRWRLAIINRLGLSLRKKYPTPCTGRCVVFLFVLRALYPNYNLFSFAFSHNTPRVPLTLTVVHMGAFVSVANAP